MMREENIKEKMIRLARQIPCRALLRPSFRCVALPNKEQIEAMMAERLEYLLHYLEDAQKPDSTEEGKEDLVRSLTRSNYLSKYTLYHILESVSKTNPTLKADPEFQASGACKLHCTNRR